MEELISKYHEPDSIWTIWNIRSYNEYMSKFMVRGKFHDQVPKEIIKEYEQVERLLCYSYYCYPLIDEAFSKVTRIFESAVNLKLKEHRIENKSGYDSLNEKLKKIEKFTSPEIYNFWNHARKVRNIFAHPKPGRLMGITIFSSFLLMINILNTLFLDKTDIEFNENSLIDLKDQAKKLETGLFILEFDSKRILVWSILPYSFFKYGNILKSFWVFHPVFTYFPQTTEKLDFSLPISFRLKNVKIHPKGLTGVNLITGKTINVIKTDKEENRNSLKAHELLIENSGLEVKQLYWNFLEREMFNEVVRFLYHECWN